MKPDIHPKYQVTTVTCSCGNTFTTKSTAPGGTIHADVCSNCHPFYTGKQKILDTGGRVARFEKRFGKTPRPAAAGLRSRHRAAVGSDPHGGTAAGAAERRSNHHRAPVPPPALNHQTGTTRPSASPPPGEAKRTRVVSRPK